jgi:hypothetical protein
VKDTNQPIEARLTFYRPTGTVETELFDTEADAKAWIRRRVRQLDAEGFSVSPDDLKREVFKRLPVDRAEGGAA